MGWFEAVFIGVLQGLTEFLPVSSSAHIRIFPALFGWDDPGAAFTAVIQIGTELAVLIYFWRDIWAIATTWLQSLFKPALRSRLEARMGWLIIIGSVPVLILGVLFEKSIDTVARDLRLIGTTLIVLAIVLYIADKVGARRKTVEDLNVRDGLLYGVGQSMALIPGVSRSGATISAGLFMGYTREAAARYSFLLAMPAVFGSGLFKLPDVADAGSDELTKAFVAAVIAFIVGYAAVAWFLRYISTKSYLPFVIYRIGLGVFVWIMVLTGTLAPN